MKTWMKCCSRGALILLLSTGIVWAQGTAQLNGTVRDSSGGNRNAFAQAGSGILGNAPRNIAVGPAFWQVDLAVSRLLPFGTRQVELRLETFNLFNTFNWGDPVTNLNSATFGRITTQAGDPRILQFGVKYAF